MMERSLSRRRFLGAGTAGLAGAATLGCQGESGAGGQTEAPRDSIHDFVAGLPPLSPPGGTDDAAWAPVRARFILDPSVAYLNNASLGMPPAPVVAAVARGYEAISREPLHGKHDLQEAIARRVMPGLADLLGADAEEISLTRNATEALHLAAVGLDLGPGDEVLLTSQEHPAGRAPWDFLERTRGVRINEVFIPSPFASGDDVVSRMSDALTPNTRVMAFAT